MLLYHVTIQSDTSDKNFIETIIQFGRERLCWLVCFLNKNYLFTFLIYKHTYLYHCLLYF